MAADSDSHALLTAWHHYMGTDADAPTTDAILAVASVLRLGQLEESARRREEHETQKRQAEALEEIAASLGNLEGRR